MASAAAEEEVHYHHDFTEDELDMMLFQWDQEADPIMEYHYMKPEWQTPDAVVGGDKKQKNTADEAEDPKVQEKPNLRGDARDTGHRTVVDLNKDAPPDEIPLPLNLDTNSAVHIVEFYQPWCGHCRSNKPHYIDVARQVTRRSIAIPVQFHAVSCQLYREVCRMYDIAGFPFIYGWGIGMDIREKGIELNPAGVIVTPRLVERALGLTLASEGGDTATNKKQQLNLTTAAERQAADLEQSRQAIEARKRRLEYPSTLMDRYHNAGVSLAFVLRTGIFVQQSNDISDQRAVALHEFLQLVYWATPQSWSVRVGLVEDVLMRLGDILEEGGPRLLSTIVEQHQAEASDGWGVGVERKRQKGDMGGLGADVVPQRPTAAATSSFSNNRWTMACTKDERGMGFSCGLWDLLHIITIGTSLPEHRIFAHRSGYSCEPKQVAEIIKRFLHHFFACDVCRWNFMDMYDRCGYNHCNRLVDVMPELLLSPNGDNSNNATTATDPYEIEQQGRELSMWLWEVHNGISVRLMKEAVSKSRKVPLAEKVSAVFPSTTQCPTCWLDTNNNNNNMTPQYDPDEVFDFLQSWYWPVQEHEDSKFKAILKRKLCNKLARNKIVIKTKEHWESWWFILLPLSLVMGLLLRSYLERKANSTVTRKNV